MSWLIYKHTNKHNGKCYIGQTSQSIDVRWRNGKGYSGDTRFGKAIEKYKWSSFTHDILEDNIQTQELANEREIYWINHYKSYDFDFGYNMTPGGYLLSAESRQKATESTKKRYRERFDFIYCFELAKIFPNPTIALEWFLSNGYEYNGTKNPIVRVINKENRTSFGCHFCQLIKMFSYKPKEKLETNKTKGKRKKVVCVDTGDVFESLSDCGRQLNIKTQHLSRACKKHTKTQNMFFSYLDEYDQAWEKHIRENKGWNDKSIYCIELDKQWDSYTKCANEIGVSSTMMTRLIQSQNPLEIYRTIKGKHFCKPSEIAIFKIVDKPTERLDSRKVYCIETKETFSSITKAEQKNNCKNILKCCKNWKYTSGGYHWCFLEDLPSYTPTKQIDRIFRSGRAKSVVRLDNGEVFLSANSAAKSVDRDVASLIHAINKGTKCGGYYWKYFESSNISQETEPKEDK